MVARFAVRDGVQCCEAVAVLQASRPSAFRQRLLAICRLLSPIQLSQPLACSLIANGVRRRVLALAQPRGDCRTRFSCLQHIQSTGFRSRRDPPCTRFSLQSGIRCRQRSHQRQSGNLAQIHASSRRTRRTAAISRQGQVTISSNLVRKIAVTNRLRGCAVATGIPHARLSVPAYPLQDLMSDVPCGD